MPKLKAEIDAYMNQYQMLTDSERIIQLLVLLEKFRYEREIIEEMLQRAIQVSFSKNTLKLYDWVNNEGNSNDY